MRSSKPLGVFVVVVAACLLVPVASATAGPRAFSDVPASHPFAGQIEWLDDTEITTGYPDGTFRPGEAVSRQSMAAFMQRLFELRGAVDVAADAGFANAWAIDWTDFAGASVTVTVPPGTEALLLADFTGGANCYSGGIDGECRVRLLVDGVEMSPQHAPGDAYVFASNDDATETSNNVEGRSIVRHHGPVGPGVYTITLQTQVSSLGLSFSLVDWVLTGEAVLVPA